MAFLLQETSRETLVKVQMERKLGRIAHFLLFFFFNCETAVGPREISYFIFQTAALYVCAQDCSGNRSLAETTSQ